MGKLRKISFIFIVSVTIVATQNCSNPNSGYAQSSSVGQTVNPVNPSPILNPFASSGFLVGTLGDSISVGYNITGLSQANIGKNWSSGINLPTSHLNQFKALFASWGWSVNSQFINLAVPGDSVLSPQSSLLANAQTLTASNPTYVTIEIGTNDLCAGFLASASQVADFQTKIGQVLGTLTSAPHPPKVIVLASIPNPMALALIPGLAQSTINYGGLTPTCEQVWSIACPNLSAGSAAFTAQWQAANQALAAAAQASGSTVIYDQGAMSSGQFLAEDISSVDCYHPSISGQRKLGRYIWTAVQSLALQKLGLPAVAGSSPAP